MLQPLFQINAMARAGFSLVLLASASSKALALERDVARAVQEMLALESAQNQAGSGDLLPVADETVVHKLAPTPALERLMGLLLAGPAVWPMEHSGISLVLVARPIAPGEKLLRARVELWDCLALARRSPATRFIHRFGGWLRQRDPMLFDIVFPGEGEERQARKQYRLTRVLDFKRGSPWMGTINGYGVVIFPVVSNSISGATLTFKTERLVRRGKGSRRIVSRNPGAAIALPEPSAPPADPRSVRSVLGIDR